MQYRKAPLVALTVAVLAGAANAEPTIGVYFDMQGKGYAIAADYSPVQTVTAYIVATHTEQTVGGAAFKLQVDPRLALINATYPAGIQVGTLTEGIQLGFTNCYYGFYDNPVLLATLTLLPLVNSAYDAYLEVLPYPPAGVIQLADCNAEITTAVPYRWSYLMVYPRPTVGVYWDQAGTQANHTANGGHDETHTAYVVAVNTERGIGGAAFKLEMDPRITMTGAIYPDGTQVGTLADGIQIGFTDCHAGVYGLPVLIATLSLWTGDQLIPNGWLNIAAYPPAGAVQVWECGCGGCVHAHAADGGRATLTIPVPVEDKSWGEVKSLYGH